MSHKYLCGTPSKNCVAGTVIANNGLNKACKAHSSREDAFRCYVRYLRSIGYTQLENDGRAFRPSDGGPVLVLNKKSKFGAELRPGKSGGDVKAKRFRPLRGAGTLI